MVIAVITELKGNQLRWLIMNLCLTIIVDSLKLLPHVGLTAAWLLVNTVDLFLCISHAEVCHASLKMVICDITATFLGDMQIGRNLSKQTPACFWGNKVSMVARHCVPGQNFWDDFLSISSVLF